MHRQESRRIVSRLALSMIVRDAAALLPDCLSSVRGVADEIVIADTGSTDDTIAVASALGARVVSIPWPDDFSAARNTALKHAASDWVLVLDADEQLDPGTAQTLLPLLDARGPDAYQVTIRNYVFSLEERLWDRPAKPNDSALPAAKPYPAYVEHENVRLFRRIPDLYFVGRVHESVGPRVLETGRRLGTAPFFIHHFGLVASTETRAKKNHFYRRLGQKKVHEMPRNAQAHFELGLVELDNFHNLEEALVLFRRACQLNHRLGVAWFFQGLTLTKLNRNSEALKCLAQAEREGHHTALLKEAQGDAHYNLEQYAEAVDSYTRALERDPENPNLESKLGLAMLRADSVGAGPDRLRHAISLKPSAPELHDRLILALVWLNHLPEAAAAAEAKLGAMDAPAASDFLRAASLWSKVPDVPRAAAMLQIGLQVHAQDPSLNRALLELASAAGVRELPNPLQSSASGP
jgi:glycosyltransferase involved in cell wall biosynthesis